MAEPVSSSHKSMLASLDSDSRQFAHVSAARIGCYVTVAAAAWLLFTEHSLGGLADILQLSCTVGALAAIGRAWRVGEGVNAPSLNHWDESLVLNFLSLGLRLTRHLV